MDASRSPTACSPILAMVRASLARHRGLVGGWLVALVASSAASLAFPKLLGLAVDAMAGRAPLNLTFAALGLTGAGMGVATAIRYYFIACLGDSVVAELKDRLYGHALELDAAFYDRVRPGEVATRIALDLTALQGLLGANTSIALRSLATLVGALVMMLRTSPTLAVWALLIVPAAVLPFRLRSSTQRRLAARASAENTEAQRLAAERLAAVPTVRAHGRQGFESELYRVALARGRATGERLALVRSSLSGVGVALIGAGLLLLVHRGMDLVAAGALTAGELAQVALYASMGGLAGLELLEVWAGLDRMRGALDRLEALVRERPKVDATSGSLPFPTQAPALAFDDVTFGYPSADGPAVADINVGVKAGSTVAIVGPSGSGKSTLAALLMRFYDPTSGRVLVNGVDLRDYGLRDVRRGIALVPQAPWLMHGTIAENIAYGEPGASDERIERAARAVGAHEFIGRLPLGYATVVGDGGVELSGGQRQLIAMARAFLRDAPVVIFDEATSALDARSEQLVKAATHALRAQRTSILIAHRLATVLEADRILVVDKGRVIATGTHANLLRVCPLYREFASLQFIAGEPAPQRVARDSLGQGEPRYIWG